MLFLKTGNLLCFEFNFKYAPSPFQSQLQVTCSISKGPTKLPWSLHLQYSSLTVRCFIPYPTWRSNPSILSNPSEMAFYLRPTLGTDVLQTIICCVIGAYNIYWLGGKISAASSALLIYVVKHLLQPF